MHEHLDLPLLLFYSMLDVDLDRCDAPLYYMRSSLSFLYAAKVHYGVSLANVDWLHGTAESLLTITNLLIVLGLRQGIRDAVAPDSQTVIKATEVVLPSLPTDADSAARK